jgi:RNA polymerase sigma factor (sigma-70 family)
VPEDGPTLGALVEIHAGRLRRLCRMLLADSQEAADVVQEVFVKAIEHARAVDPPRDWDRWLTRVAVNACRDRRRAGWWRWFRQRTEPIDEVGLGADSPGPEALAMSAQTRSRIGRAFRALPERQQEVFVLRHVEEWSTSEVAEVLGMSTGTVKSHLFRAIRQLRRALGET